MSPRDAEDARFEELMAREFPEGLVPTERARPRLEAPIGPDPTEAEAAEQHAAATDDEADQSAATDGFRSWAPPDERDEPFVPPPAPPPHAGAAPASPGPCWSHSHWYWC